MTTEARSDEPRSLPTGTVTFMFTDIEGSTRLVQELGDERYGREVLDPETRLVTEAAVSEGGTVFGSEGDAHFVAFTGATNAIRAAADIQRRMSGATWPDGSPVRVRMGIHTGDAIAGERTYHGLDLHRVARVAASGHGGQILLSDSTRALVEGSLPAGLELLDLGEHHLKDLARPERIHQLKGPGLESSFPPLRTLDAAPNNLPSQVTSFVGRAEVDRALELLSGTRLLTLTGPGGTGKTRLSIQLAAESVDRFGGGVWFVPLATITDPDLVPSAIASAVGLTGAGRPPHERVLDHFRDRRALLVLDNVEQVLGAAPFVSSLLQAAPELTVVATSRSPLRLYGEQEFPVPPLTIPDPSGPPTRESAVRSEAVRLFEERARALRPDFAVTDDNAPIVVDIVRALDGLPLAIELAAARIRILSPAAIRERLTDRLGLLTGGARDLPERQRTLRGAIDWSHELLDPAERRLFARLAVFAGRGLLTSVEAVAGSEPWLGIDVLTGLDSLAEKSLVQMTEDGRGDARFAMLETIREYALERLAASGEVAPTRDRHAEAYLELARATASELRGPGRRVALDRLDDDHDNVRSALEWLIERGDCERAAALLSAAWRFWQMRGHLAEGRMRAAAVLAMPGWSEAHRSARLRALDAAGGLAYWNADINGASLHYEEALELARAGGDRREIADALYNSVFAPRPSVSIDDWFAAVGGALGWAEEALSLYRELGDDGSAAWALWAVGEARLYSKEFRLSESIHTDALAEFERLGDPFGAGWALFARGLVRHLQGEVGSAWEDNARALRLFSDAGDVSGVALVVAEAARIAQSAGDHERAHRIAGAAARIEQETGTHLASTVPEWAETTLARPVVRSEDPVLALAWAQGEAMDQDSVVDHVLGEDPTRPGGA